MIILDKPFVSDFLKQTIIENQIPVLKTPFAESLNLDTRVIFQTEKEAIEHLKSKSGQKIYTNSENAINWISRNLGFTKIPEKINLFKDKVLFRNLISKIYPEFYYKPISLSEFDSIDIREIPKPFIIKPAVGFFSMAVYKVNADIEWEGIKEKIRNELDLVKDIYPKEVMDTGKFIIEEVINGDEYAIDAYFNDKGEVVILNIMHHVFASPTDFSDRLYITSEKIIQDKLADFETFLNKIGTLAGISNFPVHVEVRVDPNGKIVPIEVNPLRFGAWCTTADSTWYAFGFNSILAYFANQKPDWKKLLASRIGKTYAMMVIENSTGYKASEIKSFNYEKLLTNFEKPLDLRKINYQQYPVFAFLFVESRNENFEELENILKSDLKEFIELQ